MAAYAALVSVMHIIDQIEHHTRPPLSLDKKQVESLTKNVTFFQEFLEGCPPAVKNELDSLESRILDAAYAAEDVIESRIVDRILAGSTSHADQVEFGQVLQKVIEDMNLIKKEVMETKEKMGVQRQLEMDSGSLSSLQKENATMVEFGERLQKVIEDMDLIKNEVAEIKEKMAVQQRSSTSSSSRRKQKLQNTTMVGFDDALLEVLDKLTGGGLNRQIIPIVGMSGIGKTTLARNVYSHPLIKDQFNVIAWATISQEYNAENVLNEILSQSKKDEGDSREMNEKQKQPGDELYKYLFGRKYLIVVDDMWSIEAWYKIKAFFPNNRRGSRVVVTTRLSNLARELSGSYVLHMKFLDLDRSWGLFCKIVFSRGDYPPEREEIEIGKKIVKKCRGLPLSIVVVGGFLAKSEYKREHWKHIEENLSSFVNSHNDEHCLKMLGLSYDQLPVHLKPCFLYMGLLEEGNGIHISKLVELWVAEGFLKPISDKNLEEVAKEYLNDLVDRNLIFIERKCIRVHDLLRDFCSKQAQAERFYSVLGHSVSILHNQRRFVVSPTFLSDEVRYDAFLSMALARSMICYSWGIFPSSNHRLLRICGAWYDMLKVDCCFQENKFQLVNLRYLASPSIPPGFSFATSLHLLWSLQTLIIKGGYSDGFTAPAEIWNMPQLRHVHVKGYVYVPDPPVFNGQEGIVLENLQTLKLVRNFKCSEDVVKRIRNINKLGLEYVGDEIEESCLENLDCLRKLKSFKCISHPYPQPDGTGFLQNLSFPHSLKKLTLDSTHANWEDLLEKIGSLPFLQNLKLRRGFFRTRTWATVEGHFPSLKFLKIDSCADLEDWNLEGSHFPCLEHLVLCDLHALDEIPSDVVEILNLKSVELIRCCNSIVISCKGMQEERVDLYGEEDVTILVRLDASRMGANDLLYLEGPKFKLSYS